MATSYTPFELIYGRQAEIPTALTRPPKLTYSYNYAQELRERLRATNKITKENVKEEKEKAKLQYDRNAKETKFKVEDKVLIYDDMLRRGCSKKLEALWAGPYKIIEKLQSKLHHKAGEKNGTHAHEQAKAFYRTNK